jgi:hypothetical protein
MSHQVSGTSLFGGQGLILLAALVINVYAQKLKESSG